MKTWDGWNQTFDSLDMSVVPYWAHPMQYNTRQLKIFVNAYNILEYFVKMGSDPKLEELRDMYKNILKTYVEKGIGFHRTSVEEKFLFHLL